MSPEAVAEVVETWTVAYPTDDDRAERAAAQFEAAGVDVAQARELGRLLDLLYRRSRIACGEVLGELLSEGWRVEAALRAATDAQAVMVGRGRLEAAWASGLAPSLEGLREDARRLVRGQ